MWRKVAPVPAGLGGIPHSHCGRVSSPANTGAYNRVYCTSQGEGGVAKAAGLRRRIQADARHLSTRRAFLAAAAWPVLAWTEAVIAQPNQKPAIVGWISVRSREAELDLVAAFKEGLTALGYREGQQYAIEGRWAASRPERLQSLAEELAAKKPALIVAVFIDTIRAAAKAAPATPIVALGE